MLAEELINVVIPTLQLEDPAEKALYWMEELRLSELPVIAQDVYQGLITRQNIEEALVEDPLVEEISLKASNIYALPQQHFYDVLRIAEDNSIQTVAIVNEDKKFLGVVTIGDTLATFAQAATQQEPGGTLVLSLKERDYSLTQLGSLIESENAKVLSLYVSADTYQPEYIKLTLKLNRMDLTRVIATLERFEYRIVAKYHHTETTDTDKERFDLLMKYLNL
jgi:acetoin utilization protein AcuB